MPPPTSKQVAALRLARFSLGLTSLIYGGFGVALLLWPTMLASVGVELSTPAARAEIRAFYGGLEVGLALFFALAAARPPWFRAGLFAQSTSLGGIALGRVLGIFVDSAAESTIYLLLGAEGSGCLLGLWALWRLGKSVP